MKISTVLPKYVDHFPEQLEEGIFYISEEFLTAGHKCCCGCGEEVITPFNNAQWQLLKEEGMISLYPSIGNWKFACRSHYIIRKNRVLEAPQLTKNNIERVKKWDRIDKDRFIRERNESALSHSGIETTPKFATFFRYVIGQIAKWLRLT